MNSLYDLTGQHFNRLTVLEYAGKNKKNNCLWKCKCDCGNIVFTTGYEVRNGHTKSCGCLKREKASKRLKKHGETTSRIHGIWSGMKTRCSNPHHKDFPYYGARGIRVCDEWSKSYEDFRDWAYAHGYSETLTLDRINVNKDYTPDNCRWVDRHTQMRNTRNNLYLTFNGETKPLIEWAEITGMDRHTIKHRKTVLGWDDEKTLTTFPKHCFKKNREITFEKIRKLIESTDGNKNV